MVWFLYVGSYAVHKFSGEGAAETCKAAYYAVQFAFGEHAAACVLQVAI